MTLEIHLNVHVEEWISYLHDDNPSTTLISGVFIKGLIH